MSESSLENREIAWFALQAKIQEEKIKKAFAAFRRGGIEPILIKGWAAAEFYPRKFDRIYADIDLCVAPEQFEQARAIGREQDVLRLNIDLHCGLRHLDSLPWEDLYKNSRLASIGETDIRVLRPEDHLRVLCVHWLMDGGAYREKLRDIFYAVENRPENFDWDRFLGMISAKRRRWIVCTIGLTSVYLGLSLKNTPIEKEALKIPKWVVKTVESEWKRGVRLRPLLTCLHDRKEFWRQIRKRVPPNPIHATVDLNGDFDKGPRLYYQAANFFLRSRALYRYLKSSLLKKKDK